MAELTVAEKFLAGFSVVLAYWLLICMLLMGRMCWGHRERFRRWLDLSMDERADMALNWGLLAFFSYAALQRCIATYALHAAQWRIGQSPIALVVPYYLPVALAGVAGILLWLMFHSFGLPGIRWFSLSMWSGWLAFGVSFLLFT